MTKQPQELAKQVKELDDEPITQEKVDQLINAISKEVLIIQQKSKEIAVTKEEALKQSLIEFRKTPMDEFDLGVLPIASLSCGILGLIINNEAMGLSGLGVGFASVISFPIIQLVSNNNTKIFDNPSWFFKLRLKLYPTMSKKYQLIKDNYTRRLIEAEEYQKFYEEKMQVIRPALELVNSQLDGTIMSIDHTGKINKQLSDQAVIKSQMKNIVSTSSKISTLAITS